LELLEVKGGQLMQAGIAFRGQLDVHGSVPLRIRDTLHEPSGRCAVDQSHRAVGTQHKVPGRLSDRRSPRVRVTAYGEQQLMMGRSETGRLGLAVAPMQESAQARAEVEQLLEVAVG
jgi:hypothetical protein